MTALTDTITALAARLEQDGSLLYLQARIRGELDTIEGILAQGVSLRKLAEALAAAGVHQRGTAHWATAICASSSPEHEAPR